MTCYVIDTVYIYKAYFALSSIVMWTSSPQEGSFDLRDFFNRCVDLFEEDPMDPWVIDTLAFLTR